MQTILLSSVLLFPFWLQLWDAHPFTANDVKYEEVSVLEQQQIAPLQRTLQTGDLLMRRRIYTSLAKVDIPECRAMLLSTCLPAEKNPLLKASILRYLQQMTLSDISAKNIAPYLKDEAVDVVAEAIRLYAMLPDANLSLLTPFLEADKAYALRLAAWKAFSKTSKLADSLGRKPLDYKEEPNVEIRHLALQVALQQTRPNKDAKAWFAEALQATADEQLLLAQHPENLDEQARRKLLSNANPVIRQALCSSDAMLSSEQLLGTALKDKSEAVRQASLCTLAKETHCNAETLAKVHAMFGDASQPVRLQAEATFLALAPQHETLAVELLKKGLDSERGASIRLHTLHCARLLYKKELTDDIAKNVSEADSAEIIAASLEALAELAKQGAYPATITAYSKHDSPLVRLMVVRCIGKLRLPELEKQLIATAEQDKDGSVRAEAFHAMGNAPHASYVSHLVTCLTKTSKTTLDERANAAWAIGKNIPANNASITPFRNAAERLKIQCTTPVIPDIVPMFDDVQVIANAFWALAVLAKRTGDVEIEECFREVADVYDVDPKEGFIGGVDETPRTPLTYSVIHQAVLWRSGKEVVTQPLPTKPVKFTFKAL